MISPEGYYEEYLKGKNEKQIMTAIRGLKQEMGRLKNTMENPDYGSEAIIKPSESTRLWCTRLYLDRAPTSISCLRRVAAMRTHTTLPLYRSYLELSLTTRKILKNEML